MGIVRERNSRSIAGSSETLQIVTFEVGGEEFGLAIGSIVEVVRPLRITQLPCMPQFIEGVINLRGAIIPVVDLRKRFERTPSSRSPRTARILIIRGAVPGARHDKDLLGLLVDSVREVMHIPTGGVEAAPEAATGSDAGFIAGVAKTSDRLIILLDIHKVLSQKERAALAEVDDVHP